MLCVDLIMCHAVFTFSRHCSRICLSLFSFYYLTPQQFNYHIASVGGFAPFLLLSLRAMRPSARGDISINTFLVQTLELFFMAFLSGCRLRAVVAAVFRVQLLVSQKDSFDASPHMAQLIWQLVT